ncbi:MAG: PA14 domain-containing protein [Polyangiaceae bacterium]
MNRSLAALPVALAAFGLFGCTIYTYPAQPAHHRPKPKPAATAPAKTSGGIIQGTSTKPTTKPATTNTSSETPVVTGQTIFGGPTKTGIRGLAYVIPEGTARMPNFDDLVPFAVLYTKEFNIASQAFTGGFPGALQQDDWFGIRYTGNFLIPTDGKWAFTLTSDDGAILYIDGRKAIDNDGVHAAKTSTSVVDLTGGSHAIRLDYFQEKKGNVALQLTVNIAGKEVPVMAYP